MESATSRGFCNRPEAPNPQGYTHGNHALLDLRGDFDDKFHGVSVASRDLGLLWVLKSQKLHFSRYTGHSRTKGMANDICRSCGKKQFNSSSMRCYGCGIQQRKDGTLVKVPNGYLLDPSGNLRSVNSYELKDGILRVTYQYILEDGKTTLRGEFPKMASPPQCKYPARLSCNFGDGFERCELMTYEGGRWICTA
jgi:hypothetical protein